MGYYDHHPTLNLREPLALIGFMGAGVQRIGHGLAARTGLPIHDIDRLIEQRAGMSRARLVIEHGTLARRAHEAALIEAALRARPPGILVLGDGALLDPVTRKAVAERAHLVHVDRPLPILLAAILRERQRAPAAIPEFVLAPPRGVEDLLSYFEARKPGYATARTRVQARGLHGAHVVDAILAELRAHPEGDEDMTHAAGTRLEP
jgi:shikimate kinase